jgi:hypothetical protein
MRDDVVACVSRLVLFLSFVFAHDSNEKMLE